jgi:hypothetical protein
MSRSYKNRKICAGYSVPNHPVFFPSFQLIMPLPKHGRWSVYVWDFLERDVIVLDPYMQGYDESKLIIEHSGSMDRLHDALFDCKEGWFIGWDVGRNHWTFKFPNALGRPCHEYVILTQKLSFTRNATLGLHLTENFLKHPGHRLEHMQCTTHCISMVIG